MPFIPLSKFLYLLLKFRNHFLHVIVDFDLFDVSLPFSSIYSVPSSLTFWGSLIIGLTVHLPYVTSFSFLLSSSFIEVDYLEHSFIYIGGVLDILHMKLGFFVGDSV